MSFDIMLNISGLSGHFVSFLSENERTKLRLINKNYNKVISKLEKPILEEKIRELFVRFNQIDKNIYNKGKKYKVEGVQVENLYSNKRLNRKSICYKLAKNNIFFSANHPPKFLREDMKKKQEEIEICKEYYEKYCSLENELAEKQKKLKQLGAGQS